MNYLFPSGIISTPSLYHFKGASSSSTPISKTAVSSSTTFFPFSWLVKACSNSAISTLHELSLFPSLANSPSMTHFQSPESESSALLMSRVHTPPSFLIRYLKVLVHLCPYLIWPPWIAWLHLHAIVVPLHLSVRIVYLAFQVYFSLCFPLLIF